MNDPLTASRYRIGRTLFCAALMVVLCDTAAWSGDVCSPHGSNKVLERSLRRTAAGLVNAIRAGQGSQIAPFISQRGMGIGVDQPFTSKKAILQQLREKSGVYCLIVSENCVPPKGGKQPWANDPVLSRYSVPLRTWLERATPYKTETTLLTDSELCGGIARFQTAAEKVEPSALELEFTYESGQWKLVNIPDSLGD